MKWAPDTSLIVTKESRQFAERREARDRVRAERNRRLAASDWTMLEDAPADRARWKLYRQALRDLDMSDPVWPEAPQGAISAVDDVRAERAKSRTVPPDGKTK